MAATAFQSSSPARLNGWLMALLFCLVAGGVIAVAAGPFGSKPNRAARPVTPSAAVAAPAMSVVEAGDALDWTALSESHRTMLRPLQAAWPGLDSVNKQRWLEVAQKVQHLSPEARERVKARMANWAKLPTKKRAQARLQYVHAKRVPAGERAELWTKYQMTPAASAAIGKTDASVTMVAPALAQVSPGATTVLVTQLLRSATLGIAEGSRGPGNE